MARTRVENYRIKPGLGYVPRKKWKFKPAPTANYTPIAATGPAPIPVAPAIPELVVFTSPQERCGVAEYALALDTQITALGAKVRRHTLNELGVLQNVQPGTVLLLHIEPSLLPNDFDNALAAALQRGAYVGMCFHYFDDIIYRRFANRTHAMVLHRDYGIHDALMHQVPLGCPVYDPPSDFERRQLREKYGLPADSMILTTVGFLAPWKKIPETAANILTRMSSEMHLQLICPAHFSGESGGELSSLANVVNAFQNRVSWSSSFVPSYELLDRVACSDLGFVYHAVNTGSCSAATKPFVSAQCPLVVTGSNHASDVSEGAYRTASSFDTGNFANAVIATARSPQLLASLRAGMHRDYERLNMRRVARMYLDVYEKIGAKLV